MPYRPSPWSVGSSLFGWGEQLPHGLCLAPTELTLLRGDDTSDSMHHFRKYSPLAIFRTPHARLELSPRCAMRNHRARGYIADISTNNSANTQTTYLFTAAVRLVYLREGGSEFSCAWARVPTYSPNCLTSVDVPTHEVSPAFGTLLPTFGSYDDATFATWEVGTLSIWMHEGLEPAVFTSDVDLGPWAWAPLPSIGNSVFPNKKTAPELRAFVSNLRSLGRISTTHGRLKTFANPLHFISTLSRIRHFIVGFTAERAKTFDRKPSFLVASP